MLRLLSTFIGGAGSTFGFFLLLAFGVIVIFSPDKETAMQPEPAPERPAPVPSKWTEKVSIRPWDAPGNKFLNPHTAQDAYPCKVAGLDGFALKTIFLFPSWSEIEQADGTVWVVVKSYLGDAETRIAVKPRPKKQD